MLFFFLHFFTYFMYIWGTAGSLLFFSNETTSKAVWKSLLAPAVNKIYHGANLIFFVNFRPLKLSISLLFKVLHNVSVTSFCFTLRRALSRPQSTYWAGAVYQGTKRSSRGSRPGTLVLCPQAQWRRQICDLTKAESWLHTADRKLSWLQAPYSDICCEGVFFFAFYHQKYTRPNYVHIYRR